MVKKSTAAACKRNVVLDTTIPSLGRARFENTYPFGTFVANKRGKKIEVPERSLDDCADEPRFFEFEVAGPRKKIFFEPNKTKCAIVTCGGLCPGINDVIRAIVLEAFHTYNMAACLGIRFGLQGFVPKYGHDVMELTPDAVADIHQFGGTVLGSSRGPQSAEDLVDALERMNIGILFMIGGDGTMRAMGKLMEEIERRKLRISVIGIPKTIDNDISFITRSFGFDTAVEKATEAIRSAHIEAVGAYNGIGMVKVMGRYSGFIAAQATLALKEVNFVLVPEFPFRLEGEGGLLTDLEARLNERKHAVIVVAEGAGQHLIGTTGRSDASGNVQLGDISGLLRSKIKQYLDAKEMRHTLKFIDPSYIIRSVPANANDRVYCGFLGQNALHAAMAGKTGMVVGRLQDRWIHLPLDLVTLRAKRMNTDTGFWRAVLETTGQQLEPQEGAEARVCLV